MYIYRCLILLVVSSGLMETISQRVVPLPQQHNYKQQIRLERQGNRDEPEQPTLQIVQTNRKPIRNIAELSSDENDNNTFESISEQKYLFINNQYHHNHHHQEQDTNASAADDDNHNMESNRTSRFNQHLSSVIGIIQDLNQYQKQNEDNKMSQIVSSTRATKTTTTTTSSVHQQQEVDETQSTTSRNKSRSRRRKKSLLPPSASSSLSSSSASMLLQGLDDNIYDDFSNEKHSDVQSISDESLPSSVAAEAASSTAALYFQSNSNENYAYEDLIENYRNADIISSSVSAHRSSGSSYPSVSNDNTDTRMVPQDRRREEEEAEQQQYEDEQQQWYQKQFNNNDKSSSSSLKGSDTNENDANVDVDHIDDDGIDANGNNNNPDISQINVDNDRIGYLTNDQPYMMMNKMKSSSSQINKLLYTKEFYLKQGTIKGIVRTFHPQSGLRDVNQFLGIPYAEAPVGNRRFLPPGVPLPWSGLKIASHLPPVCPQNLPNPNLANVKLPKGRNDQFLRLLPYLKNENEDCLYLNVYVPEQDRYDSGEKYPVIVYIHGESYEWNSGNPYDGSVLASYGQVIVVTINYRLGILGFMKPGISQTTVGNFGLFDQIAALKWIKDNIEAFNGDANRVTLMGHSTGAACVNLLMVSPVAHGLFHRAILMSGSAMADWATTNHSIHLTMQIANGVNCLQTDDDERMLKCLRNKRYKDFLKVQTALPPFVTVIGPIVDEIIIPTQPYKMMSQITETFGKYDLLFGVTELESYHVLDAIALEEGLSEKERDQFLRLYMNSRYEIRPDLAVAATLKQYMDVYNNPSKATKHEHRDVVLDILSDARIVGPLLQTGLFHADVNPRNFMYVFGHNSEAGPYASLPHSVVGEELAFVFGAPLAAVGPFHQKYSTSEKLLSEAVMTYWTNFVKTGNPKAPWKGGFINSHKMEWANYDIDWPEFNKRNQCYVNIGIPPSLEMKYRSIYMNFWNKELPNELNEIAAMQTKPNIHFYPSNNNAAVHRNSYSRNDEIIAGHIQKFPSAAAGDGGDAVSHKSDNPFHELKMLMKEDQNHMGYGGGGNDGAGNTNSGGNSNNNYNMNNGYAPIDNMLNAQPTFGVNQYKGADGSFRESAATIPVVSYANEGEDVMPRDILRSESALHILIGLIVLFLILNVIIYSTFLFKRKKKNSSQLNRKLGGFLSYDGTNDDELKRSKTHDCDDSYILDMMKRPNGEYVKTKSLSINGFKITRQLSTSTVDAHTKVSDWMSNDIDKNSSMTKSSLKTSPSFSLRGRSFLRRPHKVSVSVDATPQARSNSIMQQEPIEVSKFKGMDNTRSIIICQEIDVDAGMLDPEQYGNNQDLSAYGYMCMQNDPNRQERRCMGEPQYITAFNPQQNFTDEQITSFIDDNRSDASAPKYSLREKLEGNGQLHIVEEGRSYENVILPTAFNSNTEATKRQSLPPNSFGYFLNKMPPAPPPRSMSTLGRKCREMSADITTSPLALAKDCTSDESEEPPMAQNTLIIGPLLPKSQENIYSTLKKKPQQSKQPLQHPANENQNNSEQLHPEPKTGLITTIEICPEYMDDKKAVKPSGIKPPTIFPLKIAKIDFGKDQKQQKDNPQSPAESSSGNIGSSNSSSSSSSSSCSSTNPTPISLLGMANKTSVKNAPEKSSKIPQLKQLECKQHKYRDKSKSLDSSSSDSSSSTETVKTELKQNK